MLILVSFLIACLALGTVFAAVLMAIDHWNMCRKKGSLSKYYFDAPHRPSNPKPAKAILSSLDKWSLYALAGLVGFAITFAAAYGYSVQHPDTYCNVYKTVCATMQNGINILFPPAVAAVVIFASFKKPYYILFSINDVTEQFKIHFQIKQATIAWCISVVLQVLAILFPVIKTGAVASLFYSAMFLCQVACFVFCLWALSTSFHIVLSGKKSELKILDTLYCEIGFDEHHMRRIHLNGDANLDAIHSYFIEQLEQKTKPVEAQLEECIRLSRVEFWDPVNMRPMPSIRFVKRQIIVFAVAIFFLGLGTGFGIGIGLCCISGVWLTFLKHYQLVVGISLAIIGLFLTLFCKVKCLRDMRRALIYGHWGYCFFDNQGQLKAYIPRYPISPPVTTKWLRALLNVVTLFRIECVNGCQEDLLTALTQRLNELDKGTPERYAFALAIELCNRLDPQEEKAKAAKSSPPNSLLESWVEAIWVDIWRDEAWYKRNCEVSKQENQKKDQAKKNEKKQKKTVKVQKKREKKREKQKKVQKKGQKKAAPEKLCRR